MICLDYCEKSYKCTPLHLACMVGEEEIVKELVEAGAEIEQEDECGMKAIDYVKNSKEIAEILKKETDRIEKLCEKRGQQRKEVDERLK